ncbi:MAG: 3'-5' exonuclease domain-containing protein 2 [Dysgonamonadaceae bacterium]|nr:3'-5' exonuclease domain-containing protein 2 [Dysgonamonadaceae bacterium]
MGRTITKEEIAAFESEVFTGQICEIENPVDVTAAVRYLVNFNHLGFDTETRPAFRKGTSNEVSLIQLATNDSCFLFRLNKTGFSTPLIHLLSNPSILKIGLSLRDDFSSMMRRMKFAPDGFIDLQNLVKKYDIDDISLQKIYALLFGKKISKGQRLSNWDAELLTESQKKYAALDAWACLKIYEKLCSTKKFT